MNMLCIRNTGHTEGMAINEIEWKVQVQQALVAGQGVELVRLFAVGQAMFGAQAGARWAAAISGFDASAVTG